MGFGAASPRGRWLSSRSRPAVRRCEAPLLWTGQTEATLEIPEVPIDILYSEYADLSRMVCAVMLLGNVVFVPKPNNDNEIAIVEAEASIVYRPCLHLVFASWSGGGPPLIQGVMHIAWQTETERDWAGLDGVV